MTRPRMEFSLFLQVLSFQMKCDPNLKQWMDSNTPEEKQQAPTVPPPMTVSAAEPTTSQAPPGKSPCRKC